MEAIPIQAEPSDTTAEGTRDAIRAFDSTPEALRVAELEARLAGDAELVTRLMFAGYDGPEWMEVANRLARYGLRVMFAWILDGTVVLHCRDNGIAARWNRRCAQPFEVDDLASTTVSTALQHFRDDVLRKNRWDPARGASLSTFFIGQCLIWWPNTFREWSRNATVTPTDGELGDLPGETDEHRGVVEALDAASHLRRATPPVRRALLLRTAGYEWEEIGILMGTSASQIRGAVYRFQQQMQEWRARSGA